MHLNQQRQQYQRVKRYLRAHALAEINYGDEEKQEEFKAIDALDKMIQALDRSAKSIESREMTSHHEAKDAEKKQRNIERQQRGLKSMMQQCTAIKSEQDQLQIQLRWHRNQVAIETERLAALQKDLDAARRGHHNSLKGSLACNRTINSARPDLLLRLRNLTREYAGLLGGKVKTQTPVAGISAILGKLAHLVETHSVIELAELRRLQYEMSDICLSRVGWIAHIQHAVE